MLTRDNKCNMKGKRRWYLLVGTLIVLMLTLGCEDETVHTTQEADEEKLIHMEVGLSDLYNVYMLVFTDRQAARTHFEQKEFVSHIEIEITDPNEKSRVLEMLDNSRRSDPMKGEGQYSNRYVVYIKR